MVRSASSPSRSSPGPRTAAVTNALGRSLGMVVAGSSLRVPDLPEWARPRGRFAYIMASHDEIVRFVSRPPGETAAPSAWTWAPPRSRRWPWTPGARWWPGPGWPTPWVPHRPTCWSTTWPGPGVAGRGGPSPTSPRSSTARRPGWWSPRWSRRSPPWTAGAPHCSPACSTATPGRPSRPRTGPLAGTDPSDPGRSSERYQGKRMLAWAVRERPGARAYWNCQAMATHALTGVPAVDQATATSFGGLYEADGGTRRPCTSLGVDEAQLPVVGAMGEGLGTVPGTRPPCSPGDRSTPSASRSWPGPTSPATCWSSSVPPSSSGWWPRSGGTCPASPPCPTSWPGRS